MGSGLAAVGCESDDGAAQVGQGMCSRELTSIVASGRAVDTRQKEVRTRATTQRSRDLSRADVHDEGEMRRGDHTGLRGRRDDAAAALHDERVGFQQRG